MDCASRQMHKPARCTTGDSMPIRRSEGLHPGSGLGVGVGLAGAQIASAGSVILGVTLGALAFSSLGVLMAAPATDTPSQVMMLSNLVRLPLIFVSGVFVPLAEMPTWGRWLAPFSPLSYSADLIRAGFGGAQYFSTVTSVAVLLGFSAGFLVLTRVIHRATQSRAR
jgi:ABC-2 type transport system permease protein